MLCRAAGFATVILSKLRNIHKRAPWHLSDDTAAIWMIRWENNYKCCPVSLLKLLSPENFDHTHSLSYCCFHFHRLCHSFIIVFVIHKEHQQDSWFSTTCYKYYALPENTELDLRRINIAAAELKPVSWVFTISAIAPLAVHFWSSIQRLNIE